MNERKKTIVLAITGASGSIYGWDLLRKLQAAPQVREVHLILSPAGAAVMGMELDLDLLDETVRRQYNLTKVRLFPADDFMAPVASGSYPHDGMIIAPCSMSTLASIAAGITQNLIHRAADVALKERRPLILVPRETPLHRTHIENMLRASQTGAIVFPAMPSFYGRAETVAQLIDSVTCRVLAQLGFPLPPSLIWQGDT
ncbi:MAG: UbiX family flavin prenyltransferase [Acidobacteria bacterium]|nr:UbiX family flavin prenyltransferase [Acidobacteriota bacterium]